MESTDSPTVLLKEFTQRKPFRTRSLVITFFGDIVSQHGGNVWLGSLISVLAKFKINERLVRTTVFRLVQDDWLEAHRLGRRSYYRFSEYGEQEYERAARRIYSVHEADWSGSWQLVILRGVSEERKEKLSRSLRWQGYRSVTAGVLAKPGEGGGDLTETLRKFSAQDEVLLMSATTPEISSAEIIRDLVYKSWRLDEVAQGYNQFLNRYRPILSWFKNNEGETETLFETACFVRLMLIQDYRRLLLQEVPIPRRLLPTSWPGFDARHLAAKIYHILGPLSVKYIKTELENANGNFPEAAPGFSKRFNELS